MEIALPETEVKKKKKSKKSSSKKGKKPVDDDDETKTKKKKKGTKKTKKSKKTSEDTSEIPKPVVGEKTITMSNNQNNLVEMNPVSIQTSLSTKSEIKKTKKTVKRKIPSTNELINQYASIQLNGKILSMIYKWEFTNEPNVIRVQFLIKNNIEKDKVKIIKFEIAETMKAHVINSNNNLPLTISPNQAVTIEKTINLLSSSLIMNITLPASIQYQVCINIRITFQYFYENKIIIILNIHLNDINLYIYFIYLFIYLFIYFYKFIDILKTIGFIC